MIIDIRENEVVAYKRNINDQELETATISDDEIIKNTRAYIFKTFGIIVGDSTTEKIIQECALLPIADAICVSGKNDQGKLTDILLNRNTIYDYLHVIFSKFILLAKASGKSEVKLLNSNNLTGQCLKTILETEGFNVQSY